MAQHHIIPWQSVLLVAILAALLWHGGPVLADPSVKITAPKQKEVVSGKVLVMAAPSEDARYSYAILYVDAEGRSITNAMPLRFQFDSTQLQNGMHLLRVGLNNEFGPIVDSDTLPIYVLNPTTDGHYLPTPVMATPAVAVPVTPAQSAATPAVPPPSSPAAQAATDPVTAPAPHGASSATAPVVIRVKEVAGGPSILLDGKPLPYPLSAFIMQDRTFVLLRPLVSLAGGVLTWSGKTATASVYRHRLVFTLGESNVLVDGQMMALAYPVMVRDGHIYVPISVWQSLFGGLVGFDARFNCVMLRSHTSLVRAKMAAL